MRLLNAWYSLALLIIPLGYHYWLKRHQPAATVFPIALPAMVKTVAHWKKLLWIQYLGYAFLVLALTRPQAEFQQRTRTTQGIDIMMLLDISASMNIEDLGEQSRIDIAKQTLKRFIQARPEDRLGLVIFSGEALTLSPPTLDDTLLLKAIEQTQIGMLKDGTAIGDGLAITVNHLRTSRAKSRVIILLTDGDNNLGKIDPATAGELAAGYGIRVYTIAIGQEGRVKMPVQQKTLFGKTIVSYQYVENALNPELLMKIAQKTGGQFYRVTDAEALKSVFQEIDQLEKTEVPVKEKTQYDERFQIPLCIGMLLLIISELLGRLYWRTFP